MASTVRDRSESPASEPGPPRHSFAARARRFVRFGLVGLSGVLVNEAALAGLVDVFHVNYLVGAVLATQCSTLWNFALVEWWAFEGAGDRAGRARRFVMFWAVNMLALGLRGPILAVLTSTLHIHYLISNLISLGVLVVLRFAVADSLIWGSKPADTEVDRPVTPDDLLGHFPMHVAEELGWALNPVAESAELLGAHTASESGAPVGPPVIADATPAAPEVDLLQPDPQPAPHPRFGSIRPPTTLS